MAQVDAGGAVRTDPRPWEDAFIAVLALTGQVKLSAERAGVVFQTAYVRRITNAPFRAAWAAALRVYARRRQAGERSAVDTIRHD